MDSSSDKFIKKSSSWSTSMVIPFSVDAIPPHKPYLRPRSEPDIHRKVNKPKKHVARGIQTDDLTVLDICHVQNSDKPVFDEREINGTLLSLSELKLYKALELDLSSSQSLHCIKDKKRHDIKLVESYSFTTKNKHARQKEKKETVEKREERNVGYKTEQKVKYGTQNRLKLKSEPKYEEKEKIVDKTKHIGNIRLESKMEPQLHRKNEKSIKYKMETKVAPIMQLNIEPRVVSKKETEKNLKMKPTALSKNEAKLLSNVQKFEHKPKVIVQNKSLEILTLNIGKPEQKAKDEVDITGEKQIQIPNVLLQKIEDTDDEKDKQLEEERIQQYLRVKEEVEKDNEKLRRIHKKLLKKLRQRQEENARRMRLVEIKLQENTKENVKKNKEHNINLMSKQNKNTDVFPVLKHENCKQVKQTSEQIEEEAMYQQKVDERVQDGRRDKIKEEPKKSLEQKMEKRVTFTMDLNKSVQKTNKILDTTTHRLQVKQPKVEQREDLQANKVTKIGLKNKKNMENEKHFECDSKDPKKNLCNGRSDRPKQMEVLNKQIIQEDKHNTKHMNQKGRKYLNVDTNDCKHEQRPLRKVEHLKSAKNQ